MATELDVFAAVAEKLNKRVRVDAAQALTDAEKTQARTNIGAGTSNLAIGTAATDAKAGNYQPVAANIADLAEAVQDIVAAFIVAGTNVSVSYDDVSNTYTINAAGDGGGTTDPELVRDVIGSAIVAGSGIQITVNDAADTITVASTAVQPTRTITAGTGLTGGGDLSADRSLAVDFGQVATAAQGAKADNAVRYDTATQGLTATQQQNARANAGIAAEATAGRVLESAAGGAVTWTAASATVARALGWVIVTDPQHAGGAKGTGANTDDTAAFRAAITATPNGGTLYIPRCGDYYRLTQQGSDTYLLLVTKAIRIAGEGVNSMIGIDAAVPATTDVIRIAPTAQVRGIHLHSFTIIGAGGSTPARHAIHIDLTPTGARVSDSTFLGLHLYQTGGYAFCLTNPVNTDGFFTSQISRCLIWNGIYMERGGDSLTVSENTIPGAKGVDIGLVEGSAGFIFAYNNVTCRQGTKIRSGTNMKILCNNFEVGYPDATGSNGAVVDIDGSEIPYAWGLLGMEIRGNSIGSRVGAAAGITTNLRINKARQAIIEGNYFSGALTNHIVVTSAASETILGPNFYSDNDPAGKVSDSGTRTIRTNVVRLNQASGRELYSLDAPIVRTRSDQFVKVTDRVTYAPKTPGNNAPLHVYQWRDDNTVLDKHRIQSQRLVAATNVADAAKTIATVADGYLYFGTDALAVQSPDGSRWKLQVSNTGTLTAVKL